MWAGWSMLPSTTTLKTIWRPAWAYRDTIALAGSNILLEPPPPPDINQKIPAKIDSSIDRRARAAIPQIVSDTTQHLHLGRASMRVFFIPTPTAAVSRSILILGMMCHQPSGMKKLVRLQMVAKKAIRRIPHIVVLTIMTVISADGRSWRSTSACASMFIHLGSTFEARLSGLGSIF